MALQVVPTSYAVADYCAALERKEIIVNRDYQRSPEVWPEAARSFLVETILLGYPMPKLSLYQLSDVKSRKVYKEIVDGQQRSMAINDYFNDGFAVDRKSTLPEARGKKYSELPEELRAGFIAYPVQVDLFVSATRDEIIDVFRRINSYTVPLNPEEQRHALHQGKFKWFIYRISSRYDNALNTIGAFSDSQLVRMADTKLYTEICHAIEFGITTTNRGALDRLYDLKDATFPEEDTWEAELSHALDWIVSVPELHKSALLKPYQLYSLVLAVMACSGSAMATVNEMRGGCGNIAEREKVARGLTRLAGALEDVPRDKSLSAFAEASGSRTNVAAQRKERVRWFCQALEGELS
jgi:hypothetical protein